MSTEVQENEAAQRFELHVDAELAGFVDWTRTEGEIALVHTEIFPRFGGQGLGTLLVDRALDVLRSRDERVLPLCSFVPTVMARHPEYVDLVPEARRAEFGLADVG
ncbi:MAG: GNAT family N-acetyltransferase [Nocardioidaceae bacterium]